MNNLLESVESLNSVCFSSEACRSMLLCPSNSASHLLNSLSINYDNISNLFPFYYTCFSSPSCCYRPLNFYANAHCSCGKLMNEKIEFLGNASSSTAYSGVFCNTAVKFMISDDLLVSQFSVESVFEQLSKLDIKQWSCLESANVNITAEKIVELLKWLLVANTSLTNMFLGFHEEKDKLVVDIQPPLRPKCDEIETSTASTRKITWKLHVKEDGETAFFVEADDDFVDLLFGFLTYPMSAVIKKLGGHSNIRCMDNLYNSVEALKTANCFNNNELIGKLLNPKLPSFLKTKNQLINLNEETQTLSYFTCSDVLCQNSSKVVNIKCTHYNAKYRQLNLTDSKCDFKDDPSTGERYLRVSKYMITDNFVIRQPSSHMVSTSIVRKNAEKGIDSLKGIHAKNIEIEEHEALALLQASITSENVLTDALLGVERGGKHSFRSY